MDLWSNHPTQCRVSWSRILKAVSSWVFDISKSGISLGNLFQCLTTFTVKKTVWVLCSNEQGHPLLDQVAQSPIHPARGKLMCTVMMCWESHHSHAELAQLQRPDLVC